MDPSDGGDKAVIILMVSYQVSQVNRACINMRDMEDPGRMDQ